MAKSSGGMNFNINLNGVDKFLADAARSDDALKRILDTLDKISRGNNLQKYWADQYKSIEGLADAFERARKHMHLSADGKEGWMPTVDAEELIKSINAFAAHSEKSFDDVASMMSKKFGEGAQAVISLASEAANKLDSAFSVKSMKDSFAALDEMRKASTESVEMLGRLDSASTKRLQQELRDARQELFETQDQLREFQQVWDRIGSGGDVSGVIDQIDTLEKRIQGIRNTAYNEFETFLNGNDISSNFGGAQKYFDQILDGSMTARQAIAEFKAEFNNMFEGGASGEMDAVYSMFTQIRDAISKIPGMLESVITNMRDMGAFSGEAEKTAESLQRVEERTTAIANSGADLQPMADAIANIASGIKETGDGSASTLASLQGIVEALGRLGNIDSGSLTNISMMLRSIASMNGFTASSKGLDTLVETLDKLSRFSDTSALAGLSSIDLSKLKVSKAALENLATYLPKIQGVDISPLQKLANINWTNLDGLKLTKTNLENVTNLIEKTGFKTELSGFQDAQTAIGQIGDSLDGLKEKVKSTFDLTNAITQAKELASQYAAVKSALDDATAQSSGAVGTPTAGGSGSGGKGASGAERYIRQLIELQNQLNVWIAKNSTAYEQDKAKIDSVASAISSTISNLQSEIDSYVDEVAKAGVVTEDTVQGLKTALSQITGAAAADDAAIKAASKAAAEEAAKTKAAVREIADLYKKLYEAQTNKYNAARVRDNPSVEYYRQQEKEIQELVNIAKEAYGDLTNLARAERDVAAAAERSAAAQRTLNAARAKESASQINSMAKELASYQEQLNKLANFKGINFLNDTASMERWNAEVKKAEELLAKLTKSEGRARIPIIAELDSQIDTLQNLRNELNEVNKYLMMLEKIGTDASTMAFGGNPASVQEYEAQVQRVREAIEALRQADAGQTNEAVAGCQREITALENLKKSLNETATAEENRIKAQMQADRLANQIEVYASKNGALPAETLSTLRGYIDTLRSGEAVANGTFTTIKAGFDNITSGARAANAGGKTFFQTLQDGWKKFGGWSLVSKSFMMVIRTFKDAVTAVKEVDAAMTELRKVTDLAASGYDAFFEKATRSATQVGAKLSDTINATAD